MVASGKRLVGVEIRRGDDTFLRWVFRTPALARDRPLDPMETGHDSSELLFIVKDYGAVMVMEADDPASDAYSIATLGAGGGAALSLGYDDRRSGVLAARESGVLLELEAEEAADGRGASYTLELDDAQPIATGRAGDGDVTFQQP